MYGSTIVSYISLLNVKTCYFASVENMFYYQISWLVNSDDAPIVSKSLMSTPVAPCCQLYSLGGVAECGRWHTFKILQFFY